MSATTNDKDRKARKDLLAYQYNLFLACQGLSVASRRDRKSMSAEAAREAAEQRQIRNLRRKPSYIAIEAQQHDTKCRLIRAGRVVPDDGIEPPEEAPSRPTFQDMQAARTEFPPICAEVREHKRRKREQRRKLQLKRKNEPAKKK